MPRYFCVWHPIFCNFIIHYRYKKININLCKFAIAGYCHGPDKIFGKRTPKRSLLLFPLMLICIWWEMGFSSSGAGKRPGNVPVFPRKTVFFDHCKRLVQNNADTGKPFAGFPFKDPARGFPVSSQKFSNGGYSQLWHKKSSLWRLFCVTQTSL